MPWVMARATATEATAIAIAAITISRDFTILFFPKSSPVLADGYVTTKRSLRDIPMTSTGAGASIARSKAERDQG